MRELRAVPVNHLGAKRLLPAPTVDQQLDCLLMTRVYYPVGGLLSFPASVLARGAQSDWTKPVWVESLALTTAVFLLWLPGFLGPLATCTFHLDSQK